MTTAQVWIDQTRDYLMSNHGEELNRLSAPYTAGGTTLSFQFPLGGIREGARLSIGTNTFYVWQVSGSTATVQGGFDGSVDANAASGTIVRVNPRFTDYQILRELNNDLTDLCSPANGLYQLVSREFPLDITQIGYDMPNLDGFISVLEVRVQGGSTEQDWPRVPTTKYRIQRFAPSVGPEAFPSGTAFYLYDTMGAVNGDTIAITYRREFTRLTSSASTLDSTGVPLSAYDLPPLGAAINLLSGREVKRAFTESQGDPRRATEVPNGAVTASANALRLRRAQRVQAEKQRLDGLYPIFKDA